MRTITSWRRRSAGNEQRHDTNTTEHSSLAPFLSPLARFLTPLDPFLARSFTPSLSRSLALGGVSPPPRASARTYARLVVRVIALDHRTGQRVRLHVRDEREMKRETEWNSRNGERTETTGASERARAFTRGTATRKRARGRRATLG